MIITNTIDENVIWVPLAIILFYFLHSSSWYQSSQSGESCLYYLVNSPHYCCSPSSFEVSGGLEKWAPLAATTDSIIEITWAHSKGWWNLVSRLTLIWVYINFFGSYSKQVLFVTDQTNKGWIFIIFVLFLF